MQPLQCVLQHHVASPHASPHMASNHHNNYAAITPRSATQVPKRPMPTHTRTTAQCRTPCRHQSYVKGTPAATASQTSCPSLAAAATLREKQSVSRRGVLPNTSPHVVPCNSHAAITMRFAASRGIPACISAHGIKPSQQLCSHHTSICNHRFQNALCLRTHEQPATFLQALQCVSQQGLETFMQPYQCDFHLMYSCLMFCYVMYCCALYCYVMYCCVMYCRAMYCYVMCCCVM